jgi:hypothetical protein
MLAAVTGNEVALAGVLVGLVGGAGGVITALWIAPATRRHERQLASEARLYGDLRDAYASLLEKLYDFQIAVDRARPRHQAQVATEGPPAELLELLHEELGGSRDRELHAAFARASTVASDEVAAALDRVSNAFESFWTTLNRVEIQVEKSPAKLEEAREEYAQSLTELEKAMRKDVRSK